MKPPSANAPRVPSAEAEDESNRDRHGAPEGHEPDDLAVVAPTALRMPISRVRCATVNATRP